MSVFEWVKWVVCSVPFSSLALAALPPLSPSALQGMAEVVLVGTVEGVDHRTEKVFNGTDEVYTAQLKVERVEKGSLAAAAKSVQFHFRRTGERPEGWAGPQGQNRIPATGAHVRVFARMDDKGELTLLAPNGWELVR